MNVVNMLKLCHELLDQGVGFLLICDIFNVYERWLSSEIRLFVLCMIVLSVRLCFVVLPNVLEFHFKVCALLFFFFFSFELDACNFVVVLFRDSSVLFPSLLPFTMLFRLLCIMGHCG